MSDGEDALRARIRALLDDTVSAGVTLDRIALLLRSVVPSAVSCGVWLGQRPEDEHLAALAALAALAGGAGPAVAAAPTAEAPIGDRHGRYGRLTLAVAPGAGLSPRDRALLTWTAEAMAPLARVALGLDVPRTPRPERTP